MLRTTRNGSAGKAQPSWANYLNTSIDLPSLSSTAWPVEATPTNSPDLLDWKPLPGPQTLALTSKADVIGYGGAGGGGKTDLLIGAALTEHTHALILRRENAQTRAIVERTREILGSVGRLNENFGIWRDIPGGRMIEFGGCKNENDKLHYKGRPHDLKAFDEATEFSESQVRFILGWMRTTKSGQRCRAILTFNPPMTESGEWIVRFFAPWLDPQHPSPAKPGELRYFGMVDGQEREFAHPEDAPEGVGVKSRTFIPAELKDNPYQTAEYAATVDSLPEPLRSQLKGDFAAGKVADPWQCIPAEWVKLAQARWTAERPRFADGRLIPLSCIGQDVARGGADDNVLAKRYGAWFAPLEVYPGKATPDGPTAAALALGALEPDATVNVDVIGVGGSVFDSLSAAGVKVCGINFAEGSDAHDVSGKMGFLNVRAEGYWLLREALDPASGQNLALPPDPQLLSDLCAPRWKLTARGIQIEEKAAIKQRLGRSPDRGDAVVLAHLIRDTSFILWSV